MRTITDHIVTGDEAPQLTIEVTDEPGPGGANHRYEISGFNQGLNPSVEYDHEFGDPFSRTLVFQNGPIKEAGVNGITQEALLAIVIDRLRSFQEGPFKCFENEHALVCCHDALIALQKRTKARIARGVEGMSVK